MSEEDFPKVGALTRFGDEAFWRSLQPQLPITEFPLATVSPPGIAPSIVDNAVARCCAEGYFETPPVLEKATMTLLADTVLELSRRGIPPLFAFMYDAFWQLFAAAAPIVTPLLGPRYKLTPSDVWVWNVDQTSRRNKGWAPHRDLLEDTLRPDKTPLVMSLWLPLTDATPLNGCMYVLPTHLDAELNPSSGQKITMSDVLHNIRALPAQAGSILGWNTRILHWGGKSSEWAENPRISVGMYLQAEETDLTSFTKFATRELQIDPVVFDRSFHLSFEDRLAYLAGTLYIYRARVQSEFPEIYPQLAAFSATYSRQYSRTEKWAA